jgi:AcrR family transcriptional regulator
MPEGLETRASARERLLAAADELFYAEGIHTVGIDRVIERAGVAKASLYSAFGSKDELVRAYLMRRHERRQARILASIARYDEPREKLLGIFDYLGDSYRDPRFRGCPFVNANAEAQPGGPAEDVANLSRAWTRTLVRGLVEELGIADSEGLAAQLILLYDGATVAARLDHNPAAAETARAVAEALLDTAGARSVTSPGTAAATTTASSGARSGRPT